MAVAPLFVADMDALKAPLRLAGAKDTGGAVAILDQAVLTVRAGFYRRLGAARITVLKATATTDTPTTTAEILRVTANSTEIEWVRAELLRLLPTLFQDASGDAQDIWNREAPFKGQSQPSASKQAADIMVRVQANLEFLETGDSEDESPGVLGGDIAPDTDPPNPFDTIFPDGVESLNPTEDGEPI